MKNANVKIRLTNDMGRRLWLTIDYITIRGRKPRKHVDNYYLTENARWATAVPLKEARKWMREAKYIAGWDGIVVEKGEYITGGKPTTLAALGLKRKRKIAG